MDQFLLFWSLHNIAIIEGLVAVILVSSLFVAFRTFFARPDDMGGSSLDSAQIEKTLQKILEAQGQVKTSAGKAPAVAAAGEDMSIGVDLSKLDMNLDGEPDKASEAAVKELETVRAQLVESQKQIESLQAQAASATAAPAAPANAGNEEKIKELEARLAEYEIISEDIADLSRFREENDKLKLEIEQLRSKSAAAPAAPAPPAAAAPEPPPAVAPAPAAKAPGPEPVPEVVAAALAPEAPAADPAADSLIDDELMKEFAAVVEQQQAVSGVVKKAGAGDEAAEKPADETEKLMNEFESFVAKKS